MKELSIEEKAKAYDEALKVLHKYDGANIMFTQDLKEEMFPELKKSKNENTDEKIRKALIKLVTNHASMDLFIEYDIHSYEALDWLEKQGNKDKFIQLQWKPSDEQMDALHYVTNFDYGGHKATLVSLYEQLKKLKG